MDASNVIGARIIFKDYLGIEHIGSIGWIEPYQGENPPIEYDGEEIIAWIYIIDENPERNIHTLNVNGEQINYTEMRLSTEVSLLEEGVE